MSTEIRLWRNITSSVLSGYVRDPTTTTGVTAGSNRSDFQRVNTGNGGKELERDGNEANDSKIGGAVPRIPVVHFARF